MVLEISHTTQSQRLGAVEMVKAIENISGVAQSNAESTEAVTRSIAQQTRSTQAMAFSVVELHNLSQELDAVVGRFHLGEDS